MKKKTALLALACFAFGSLLAAAAPAQTHLEPDATLQTWLAALADEDHATYVACLYSESRNVPEFGSEEAMQFWAKQMQALRGRGFAGRFEIEAAPGGGPRWPAGAVLARPIVAGKTIRDAIVLVEEAGEWKILRIFS